jgi:ketosteroid isomerase-like protein
LTRVTLLYLNYVTSRSDANTPRQNIFGMNVRSLFVCGAFLLSASVAYAAGSYQRTRDGKTLVWTDSTRHGEEATWLGKRDKNGFATGSGTLTWYKVEPTVVTGSNILDTRRHAVVIRRYSGKMVRGKFKGAVTYVDANGKTLQVTSVSGANRQSRRQNATPVRTPRLRAIPTAEQTPTPPSQQTVTRIPERTSAPATPEPAPEQTPSPIVEEPQTAVPPQTATLAAQGMATPPSEQQARQPDARSTTVRTPTRSDDSLRSRSARPLGLPKPPPTVDAQTVASLDTVYQAAVKANDVAIMDEILADDFVLVTDRGASLTKADLIKEAREKRTIYEHQEAEEGTQKVRIWRDTAVVTALLRIKGTRDQNPFDYKMWLNETYVRTPTGWRYVFGQALKPDAK